ncbi:cellulose binding domain-containing protein [Streptomyces sp. NPDC001795]|uniref:cellulose binding domain-containing protein n=1 Tax=Streptomyces sp. NPDC001795 TaxID=3154525 RepID=UPI0033302759
MRPAARRRPSTSGSRPLPPSCPAGPSPPSRRRPPTSGACSVTYRITNQWSGGFQADVQLTNTGSTAWSGWSLSASGALGHVLDVQV